MALLFHSDAASTRRAPFMFFTQAGVRPPETWENDPYITARTTRQAVS